MKWETLAKRVYVGLQRAGEPLTVEQQRAVLYAARQYEAGRVELLTYLAAPALVRSLDNPSHFARRLQEFNRDMHRVKRALDIMCNDNVLDFAAAKRKLARRRHTQTAQVQP